MLPKFTKRQWLTLITIGLADFCNAICVSLQAPFFPHEAEKKGCTATEYGLVFGIFELVVFLVSPLYGAYLNTLGPKVLFNTGIFTTGTSAIVFGLIDKIQGRTLFITLAFVIRIIEALGNAAFLTASFAIIAKEFPDKVSVTFASLETFFGLGLIVGPLVGGVLYSVGGYFLPFVTLGLCLFMTAIVTLWVLPKHQTNVQTEASSASLVTLLKIPSILVCSLSIIGTSASIGFLGALLEPHLRQFNLGPVVLGVVFIINGAFYAATAPMWGYMVDKFLNPKIAALMGSCLIAVAFSLIGPVSFLPFETKLSLVIVGLIMQGFGIGAVLVSSFTDALKTAVRHGLPDSIETYGLISGLWTSTFAFGAFIGPSISGLLYDTFGFRDAVIFIIALHIIVAFILLLSICTQRTPNPYKELGPTEPLLRSRDSIYFNERSSKYNSISSNGSTMPIDQHASMANLVVGNGINHKNCHSWSSRCEQDSMLTRNGSFYGTCGDGVPQRIAKERETIA